MIEKSIVRKLLSFFYAYVKVTKITLKYFKGYLIFNSLISIFLIALTIEHWNSISVSYLVSYFYIKLTSYILLILIEQWFFFNSRRYLIYNLGVSYLNLFNVILFLDSISAIVLWKIARNFV